MVEISRRHVLLGSGVALLGAACGSGDGSSSPNTFEAVTTSITQPPRSDFSLAALFPAAEGFLVAGINQRLPFRIVDNEGLAVEEIEGSTVLVRKDDQEVANVPITFRTDALEQAFLTLDITFSEVGVHTLSVEVQGFEATAAVQVSDRSEVLVPQIGDMLASFATPTLSDELGYEPICTDDPPCPLHEVNIADSAGTLPTALFVGTPRYCQIGVCSPMLDQFVKSAESSDGAAFIHAEVYKDADQVDNIINAEPSAAMAQLHLTYEPVLFVTDASGVITSRLDTVWDQAEFDAALKSATS